MGKIETCVSTDRRIKSGSQQLVCIPTLHEENTIINRYWHVWKAGRGCIQTWFPGRLGIPLQREIKLRGNSDSFRLHPCLQLLFWTNFLQLLSDHWWQKWRERSLAKFLCLPSFWHCQKHFWTSLNSSSWGMPSATDTAVIALLPSGSSAF